jgi:multiple sugar transport system substrate-binding protein
MTPFPRSPAGSGCAAARRSAAAAIALAAALLALAAAPAMAQPQTLTMWSHWPDEASKRGFIEERVKQFEAATPQCKVNLQFVQKADLYTSVKTSVRTGQAPDIFWLEPDEIAFAKSGYLEPLDKYVDLANLEDWARRAWTWNGKVYAMPQEAYSVELYYNRELMKKIGVTPPAGMQMTQAPRAWATGRTRAHTSCRKSCCASWAPRSTRSS